MAATGLSAFADGDHLDLQEEVAELRKRIEQMTAK